MNFAMRPTIIFSITASGLPDSRRDVHLNLTSLSQPLLGPELPRSALLGLRSRDVHRYHACRTPSSPPVMANENADFAHASLSLRCARRTRLLAPSSCDMRRRDMFSPIVAILSVSIPQKQALPPYPLPAASSSTSDTPVAACGNTRQPSLGILRFYRRSQFRSSLQRQRLCRRQPATATRPSAAVRPDFFSRFRETLGAQPVDCGLHVAVNFCQCFFRVHHACARCCRAVLSPMAAVIAILSSPPNKMGKYAGRGCSLRLACLRSTRRV